MDCIFKTQVAKDDGVTAIYGEKATGVAETSVRPQQDIKEMMEQDFLEDPLIPDYEPKSIGHHKRFVIQKPNSKGIRLVTGYKADN